MHREQIVIVRKFNIEFSAEILVLRSPKPKNNGLKKLSVYCSLYLLMSLYGLKDVAQKLLDRYGSSFHKTCTSGHNRYKKSSFEEYKKKINLDFVQIFILYL